MPVSANGTKSISSNNATRTANSVSNGSSSNSRTDRAPSSSSKTSSPQGSDSRDNGARAGVGGNAPQGSDSKSKSSPANGNAGTPRDQKTGAPPGGNQGIAGLKAGLGIGARATTTAAKARDDRMPSTSDAMKRTVAAAAPKKSSSITGYKDLTKVASLDAFAPFSNLFGKTSRQPAPAAAPVGDESYFGSLMSRPPTSGEMLANKQASLDSASALDSLNDTLGIRTADPDLQGAVNTSVPNGKVTVDPLTGKVTQAYNPQVPGAIPKPAPNPLRDIAKFTKDPDVDFGEIESEALSRLVSLQSAYDKPINITEGEAWRKSPFSEHVLDPGAQKVKAMDLSVPTADRAQIANLASALGFGGVGIYNNFPNMVHVDTRKTKMGWGPGGTIKTLSQVKDPALRAAIEAHNTRKAAPDTTIAMGAPTTGTTQVASVPTARPAIAPLQVTQNIPKPMPKPAQPKPAATVNVARPANMAPPIAAVDDAVKNAIAKAAALGGWAVDAAGNVVENVVDAVRPAPPSNFPARPSVIANNNISTPPEVSAIKKARAAEPIRQAATGVTQPSPPTRVAASLAHPVSTPRKADYRVNPDGTITNLATNTEISQTPPAGSVHHQQVASVPQPPAAPTRVPVSGPPGRAVQPASMPASVVDAVNRPRALGVDRYTGVPAAPPTGNYSPEEIAASKAMADEMNRAALKDTATPTADEVFDARNLNQKILEGEPTAKEKAMKIGAMLRDAASVLSNPVVGISSIAARKVFQAIKSDREKMDYLKNNYPATYEAEKARRAEQNSQRMSSDERGGKGSGIFTTKTGVTMSEDDMALIGSLDDAERDRLVRLSKTSPSTFQAELASIRSASGIATSNANQLQQILSTFV